MGDSEILVIDQSQYHQPQRKRTSRDGAFLAFAALGVGAIGLPLFASIKRAVVAHIVGTRNLPNIALAGVRFVAQFAPVMSEQHKRRIVLLTGLPTGVPQRLGKVPRVSPADC
ncbi:hypothetical protein [Thalassoroseus pseudoceratinae]|uniref:hypothetical protein n=1 Tax=Thalassoroseus pseudoceratinae TaxID=2713176 RepID=UPI00141DA7D2|nr:hypothetical protein [Thalassoroseus pseudoceratinae]